MEEKKVVHAIPSSFVATDMKCPGEGSGEAKLHIGSTVKQEELDDFFQFNTDYTYCISKESLLNYMREVKLEFIFHFFNKYNNATLESWRTKYNEISNLPDLMWTLNMTKFISGTRYYVRTERKDVFSRQMRGILVPKITNIVFVKNEESKTITISPQLNPNWQQDNLNKDDVTDEDSTDIEDNVVESALPTHLKKLHNRILFGAPGTGKSWTLEADQKGYFSHPSHFERVTFHPAYSYAQFFGAYKPVSEVKNIDGAETDSQIVYRFVPGPFIRILLRALADEDTNYLLLIEEINRADVAAVFGDVFQLLDRKNGESQYPIDIPEDLRRYIKTPAFHEDFKINWENVSQKIAEGKLKLPSNLYIWGTMNSADQGVHPMDTAFKRRWNFEYIDIDEGADELGSRVFEASAKYWSNKEEDWKVADGSPSLFTIDWENIRQDINVLLKNAGVNEDKWLGPFFISKEILDDTEHPERFVKMFENKILMYLFEDAARYQLDDIFACKHATYSEIRNAFRTIGKKIFIEVNP